jgi:hypothetical protein
MTTSELKRASASGTPDLIRAKVVETKPKKVPRSRRVALDEDEPDLIAAK